MRPFLFFKFDMFNDIYWKKDKKKQPNVKVAVLRCAILLIDFLCYRMGDDDEQ